MKEPLRVPFEAGEPDLAGPRLVHETGGDDRQALPEFCDTLREARLRGGYSVADAANVLRIQEHYLEALEEGRFSDIPGTTYAIGFLRSYAGFLGLDPGEIIDDFKREQGLAKSEQRLDFPSPSESSPKPKFWLVLLVLVLAGLAYGGWQYQSTGGQLATDLVDDVSTRLTEAVGLATTDAPEEAAAASETSAVAPDAAGAAEPAATVVADAATVAPSESASTASGEVNPAPAAARQEEPAPVEPAQTTVPAAADPAPATSVPEQAGAEDTTEVAAVEELPTAGEPVPPPPAKVEAVAETVSQPVAPVTPAATTATIQTVELTAPSEPVVARVDTAEQRPAVAAPLNLAVAVGAGSTVGDSSADEAVASESAVASLPAAGSDTVETAAAEPEPSQPEPMADARPEPVVDAAPEETASLSAPTESESRTSAATSYVPKVYGRSNLDARVVITAVDDSWVQVQGPDNELLLTRILHAGDTYRVPDRAGIVMVTGNAGGLEVRVDDTPAPALGPLGVVLRNIALDPDRLLAGTATGG